MNSRIALVTGAGSGIGRAVSVALQSAGYSVVLAGRRRDALEKTAAAAKPSGLKMLPVATDIGKLDSVRAIREDEGGVRPVGSPVQQRRD